VTYITGLPEKQSAQPEWQAAIEALMLVADRGGPTMFARIGVMRALNRHAERVFDPSRKEKHWPSANSRAIDEAGSSSAWIGHRVYPAAKAATNAVLQDKPEIKRDSTSKSSTN
jgi:hypothetical protein